MEAFPLARSRRRARCARIPPFSRDTRRGVARHHHDSRDAPPPRAPAVPRARHSGRPPRSARGPARRRCTTTGRPRRSAASGTTTRSRSRRSRRRTAARRGATRCIPTSPTRATRRRASSASTTERTTTRCGRGAVVVVVPGSGCARVVVLCVRGSSLGSSVCLSSSPFPRLRLRRLAPSAQMRCPRPTAPTPGRTVTRGVCACVRMYVVAPAVPKNSPTT